MDPLLVEQLLAAAQALLLGVYSGYHISKTELWEKHWSALSFTCLPGHCMSCSAYYYLVGDQDESLPSRMAEWLTCKKIWGRRVAQSLPCAPCLGRRPIWQGKPGSELLSEGLKILVTCAMRI